MYINQAIKKAVKRQKGISRESWMPGGSTIMPTNMSVGMMIIPYKDFEHGRSNIIPRWEPTADDLTAEDWFVY